MNELCDACKRDLGHLVRVTVGGKFFKVCSFECKDVITKGRSVDVGCGIIEGDEVKDVKMCSDCSLSIMPFNCYVHKRDQGRKNMFVGYGRRKKDE